MSNKAQAWAWSLTVGRVSAKVVLAILGDKADEADSCYPGVEMIAAESELSVRSVKSQIAHLEAIGAITRQRRYRGFGERTSDRYVLSTSLTTDQINANRRAIESSQDIPFDPRDSGAQPLGAGFAPNGNPPPMDNSPAPLGAKSAPNESDSVDNPPQAGRAERSLGATRAPLGANERRALKEEPSELTIRSSSSNVNPPHPQNDSSTLTNDDEDDPEKSSTSPECSERTAQLRQVHTGLDYDRLRSLLGDSLDQIDVVTAALDVVTAAPRTLGDATRYLAAAIRREPARWLSAAPGELATTGPADTVGLRPPVLDPEVARRRLAADVSAAKARRLIDPDWPDTDPLPDNVAEKLAAARQRQRNEMIAASV